MESKRTRSDDDEDRIFATFPRGHEASLVARFPVAAVPHPKLPAANHVHPIRANPCALSPTGLNTFEIRAIVRSNRPPIEKILERFWKKKKKEKKREEKAIRSAIEKAISERECLCDIKISGRDKGSKKCLNRGWSIPVEKIVIREVLSSRSKGGRIGGGTCFPVPVNGASKPRKELVKRFVSERREEEQTKETSRLAILAVFAEQKGGGAKGEKIRRFIPPNESFGGNGGKLFFRGTCRGNCKGWEGRRVGEYV